MSGYRITHDETHLGDVERTDFDLRDEKGRAVGYTVSFSSVEWSLYEDSSPYVTTDREAVQAEADELNKSHAFCGFTSATRDGQAFGAWTSGVYAPTLEGAKAKAARRMAGARKRYEKKYGAK
jgi:hypothetical protein